MIKMEVGCWGKNKITEMSNEHLVHARDKMRRNIQASYKSNPKCTHIDSSKTNTWEYKLSELEQELKIREDIIKKTRCLYSNTLS